MNVKRLLAGTWMFLTFGFAACTDELGFEDRRVEEGLPARVSLSVRPAESAEVSRAANEGIESQVNNLYLFIFSSDGEVMYRNYWDAANLQHTGGSLSQGTLDILTASANDTRIVGVANLTDGAVSTVYEVTKDMLDAITTLDDLKKLKFDMEDPSVSRMGAFLMTGFAEDNNAAEGEDKTSINIPPTGESGNFNCTLWLERVDARVKFVVTAEAENTEWKDFSFQPREWRVCEVPQQTLALEMEGATGDYDGAYAGYFNSTSMPFEDVVRVDETALYAGGSFEFYVPENRKTPLKNIENNDYALREKRDKGTEVNDAGKPGQKYENDGAFTYANAHSTYVEMTGTLSYRDAKGYLVSASVTFTVHLGYVSGVNDYNTNRNTRYTYNVKVKGVNNIVVEVTQETPGDEPRPGYEGNVVFSSNETYFLDAHYDRALLHIKKTDIISTGEDETPQEMSWGVRTPYGAGIYEGTMTDNVMDYKWIKFAINKDYGTPANQYVKYPGDQNYNDPSRAGQPGNDEPSGYNGHTNHDARLLDVKQLVERLKEEAKNESSQIFETDGTVAVTAFIDEYVYVRDPRNPNAAEDFTLWKDCVEEDDRQLHITNGRSQYSPDGASSVVESIYTFRQKSIRTVYDKTKVETAWGLESIMEAVGDKRNQQS